MVLFTVLLLQSTPPELRLGPERPLLNGGDDGGGVGVQKAGQGGGEGGLAQPG